MNLIVKAIEKIFNRFIEKLLDNNDVLSQKFMYKD